LTLAQLHSFVLVARLGSVKAAAAELAVTEAAVSVSVAALRRELGDELFVRGGRGIVLTPGGRRLAALAAEILALAEQARRSVGDGQGQLRIGATGLVGEYIGPLIAAFIERDPRLEVEVQEAAGERLGELLEQRRIDVALGPAPGGRRAERIAAVPFLRCRMIVVASARHPLAGRPQIPVAALARQRWLVGPGPLDPTTAEGLLLARAHTAPAQVRYFTSHAAALGAAAAGEGVALSPAHAVLEPLRRRALVRLDVAGTPMVELWHASTLGVGYAAPAALSLQRFATTPEAVQALSAGRHGARPPRARPAVHVTLWRSIAQELDARSRTEPAGPRPAGRTWPPGRAS